MGAVCGVACSIQAQHLSLALWMKYHVTIWQVKPIFLM